MVLYDRRLENLNCKILKFRSEERSWGCIFRVTFRYVRISRSSSTPDSLAVSAIAENYQTVKNFKPFACLERNSINTQKKRTFYLTFVRR